MTTTETKTKAPNLTKEQIEICDRDGATNEEIAAVLHAPDHWTYLVRNPLGKVIAYGIGDRAECIRRASYGAKMHATYDFPAEIDSEKASALEQEERIKRAFESPWQILLWPPDNDPPFWYSDDDLQSIRTRFGKRVCP